MVITFFSYRYFPLVIVLLHAMSMHLYAALGISLPSGSTSLALCFFSAFLH